MRLWIALFLFAAAACAHTPTIDRGSEEAALETASSSLVAAESAFDVEAIMQLVAEDAEYHMDGRPAVVGAPAIRAMYEALFAGPEVEFRAETDRLEVAASGDLAYETGINYLTMTTPQAKVELRGKFLATWKKQDGKWKVAVVAITMNQPPPSPPPAAAAAPAEKEAEVAP